MDSRSNVDPLRKLKVAVAAKFTFGVVSLRILVLGPEISTEPVCGEAGLPW
jgi:hypothetical protein